MRILIDVVHPAHVHYFRPVVERLERRGHVVLVTSREKDCTLELLDSAGIPHVPLTRAARARWALPWEMIVRDARLMSVARQFQPDLVLGKEAACAHQVAWALGIPSLALDDTDDAKLQRRLSLPFASRAAADPQAGVRGAEPLPGVSPLLYLHPDRFRPDPGVLEELGLDRPPILLRLVRWAATHDAGERGYSDSDLPALLEGLSEWGEVIVSSERALPKGARDFLRVPVDRLHDVLAASRLHVGESATMAAEAAVLGVPTIYCSSRRLWYTDLLLKRGLVHHVSGVRDTLAEARALGGESPAELRRRRDAYLGEVGDPVDRLVEAVEAAGRSAFRH